jgi:ribonuclease HI
MLVEYTEAQLGDKVSKKTNEEVLKIWRNPPEGWVKINCDASLNKTLCRMGMGVVIRVYRGTVILVRSLTKEGAVDPSAAKAMAFFQGIILGQNLGLSKIIVEGDAKMVIEALQEKTMNKSHYGHLLEDIRVTLKSFP